MPISSTAFSDSFGKTFGMVDSYFRANRAEERQGRMDEKNEERYQTQQERLDRQEAREQKKIDDQQAQQDLLAYIDRMRRIRERTGGDPSKMTEEEAAEVVEGGEQTLPPLEVNPAFMASEEGQAAAEVGDELVETGDVNLLKDPVARSVAAQAALGGYVRNSRSGEKSRSGAARAGQRVIDLVPTPDGQFAVQTQVVDEKGEAYGAPLTKGRSADSEKDTELETFSMDTLMNKFQGYHSIFKGMEQAEVMDYLRAAYISKGGDPTKLDYDKKKYGTAKIRQGDQDITYETEDGRVTDRELGRGMAFSPQRPRQYAPSRGELRVDGETGEYIRFFPDRPAVRTGVKAPARSNGGRGSKGFDVQKYTEKRAKELLEDYNYNKDAGDPDKTLKDFIPDAKTEAQELKQAFSGEEEVEQSPVADGGGGQQGVPNPTQGMVGQATGGGQGPLQSNEQVAARQAKVEAYISKTPELAGKVASIEYNPQRGMFKATLKNGKSYYIAEE